VRFFAVGDSGVKGETQTRVANAIATACKSLNCDLGLMLGDNIYPDGAESGDEDEELAAFLTDPWVPIGAPLYAVLGNHDRYGDAARQLKYGRRFIEHKDAPHAGVFRMPAYNYLVEVGHVLFVGVDTDDITDAQVDALIKKVESYPQDRIRVAFGHHPWLSNGAHGNAKPKRYGPLEKLLCNRFDLYLAGHDHDLQLLAPQCGVTMVVSGAGSKLRPAGNGPNTQFSDSMPGFVFFEASQTGFAIRFFGLPKDGAKVETLFASQVPSYRLAGWQKKQSSGTPHDPDATTQP
jgi:predicted phosphodiesterase